MVVAEQWATPHLVRRDLSFLPPRLWMPIDSFAGQTGHRVVMFWWRREFVALRLGEFLVVFLVGCWWVFGGPEIGLEFVVSFW